MIDHSRCDHEATRAARSKCRRDSSDGVEGSAPRRKVMGGGDKEPRSVKAVSDDEVDNYGQTPADRAKECMICGVERQIVRGTDPLSGRLLYVGEKCEYMVRRAPDREYID